MIRPTLETVERMASQLPEAERRQLLHQLTRSLEPAAKVPPANLYGAWRDRFPADLDLDTALSDIRTRWQRDMP